MEVFFLALGTIWIQSVLFYRGNPFLLKCIFKKSHLPLLLNTNQSNYQYSWFSFQDYKHLGGWKCKLKNCQSQWLAECLFHLRCGIIEKVFYNTPGNFILLCSDFHCIIFGPLWKKQVANIWNPQGKKFFTWHSLGEDQGCVKPLPEFVHIMLVVDTEKWSIGAQLVCLGC